MGAANNKVQQKLSMGLILVIAIMISSSMAGLVEYYGPQDYYAYPKYAYKYGVQDKVTGDFKTAHEVRDGAITKGSYSVLQPDGILRTVKYTVDPKGGFQATVINSGIGIHGKAVIVQ